MLLIVNPQAPVAQKIADERFFDVSKVKEASFLNRTSRTPLRFLMRIFSKIPILALPDFIFLLILYQDNVLSQMVLELNRTNEIEEKKTDVYSH